MKSYSGTTKFYFYLTLFSGAMLGLVLSSNFISLFIFWELTSILSFLLISFFNEKEGARKAAFQSLFVTGFGGLSLLTGIILVGSIVDSFTFTDWLANAEQIKTDSRYLPALLLILVGIFTKSAQFPFHFWLPGAMQAPTPVSSYLHSATMVKAGVFLLARLNPILGGTAEWTHIIPFVGAITMIVGSYLSITQTDIKAILAYTTISALGILVLLLGIDTKLSVKAALVFLFVHAFYKAALFMLAGFIDKKTGTREIDKLGGLLKAMPVGFLVVSIAFLSMAGLPPMLGFIGKELIYEAKVQSPGIANLVLIIGVASNIFMVTISMFMLSKLFFGKKQLFIKNLGKVEPLFHIGPGILAILSLGLGLFPNALSILIEPALSIIRAEEIQIKLKLWHGFNEVFFLSLFTVLTGTLIFYLINKYDALLFAWRRFNNKYLSIRFSEIFSNGIEKFIAFSDKNTKLIQHGYHRYYILTIILFSTALLWFQVYITRGWELDTKFSLQPFYISALILITGVSGILSAFSKSRLFTIIAMGVTGYGISLIYMYYSAIDLAITQIIVETLTVVMFVLVLQKLPKFAQLSKRRSKIRDGIIALSFGSVMTVLALKAIHVEFNHPISDYFVDNSYIEAYGKNIVNVILVDFRALDTLGEVVVLAVAAMGVYVLLNKKTQKR
jgi:multicomponent Na+:H+ antiporter subunit A